MASKVNKGAGFWHFVDNLQGDKVVWMIVLILICFSIVAVFSSTPLLALQQHISRMSIVREQLVLAAVGLGLIILCYNIKNINFYKNISQIGFVFSAFLLLVLISHINLGVIKAQQINSAWRTISIFGFQLHVFELVKVAMIMYLAWAVDTFKNHEFKLTKILAKSTKREWINSELMQKIVYIYMPIFFVCGCMMEGSTSSTLFIGGILFLTVIIGGIKVSDIIPFAFIAALGLLGCFIINKATNGEKFPHLTSSINRITKDTDYYTARLKKSKKGTKEYQDNLDKILQPATAKIAIHEGGFIGKGPGNSTQRYVVPVMFEDYMFSFIVEEYGLFGAILIIILYGSLLARGSLIAKNCENYFAKSAVAGLVMLIACQAAMHMLINVDLGPLTGQTLPMISHGNSSFIAFCIAFGIILAISRIANVKVQKATDEAKPLVEKHDEVNDGLDALDNFETSSGLAQERKEWDNNK